MSVFRSFACTSIVLLVLGGPLAWGDEQKPQPKADAPKRAEKRENPRDDDAEKPAADVRSIIPHWGLGDSWTVETVNRRIQVRNDVDKPPLVEPIQWHFAVSRFEKSLESDCVRIEVTCDGGQGRQPKTVLWIDRKSKALRRVTTQIPTLEGFREISVQYEFDSGQPAPVLGPLTALPIDMPIFQTAGVKGLESFEYTSFQGAAEAKGLDQIGFAEQVEQRIAQVPADEVRKLLRGSFEKSLEDGPVAKSLNDEPVTDVRLVSQGNEIRQLWQPGRPWPIYSDNGITVCRLVSVERKQQDETETSNDKSSPQVQP